MNFDSIKRMILAEQEDEEEETKMEPICIKPHNISRTRYHDVVSVRETKICRPVYSKRRYVDLDVSYPFGYRPAPLAR